MGVENATKQKRKLQWRYKIAYYLESRYRVELSLLVAVHRGMCLVLLLPKFRVESILVEQELVVRAGLYDEALVHYDYAVRIADGAEAVGNDDGRLCFHLLQRIDRLLNDLRKERYDRLFSHLMTI